MVRHVVLGLLVLLAVAGCPGDNAGLGASCGGNDDCNGMLQCLNDHCAERCKRAPDCGDGYSCDEDGLCQAATRQSGDTCKSEVDCEAGLSCQIDGSKADDAGRLSASCTAEKPGRSAGAACTGDADCRNGTCALGRCVDLCASSRDCARDTSCMVIPHIATTGGLFVGCLPTQGTVSWQVPKLAGPEDDVLLPVPDAARSVELVMSVADTTQKVGAVHVTSPTGLRIYTAPCTPGGACTQADALDRYFANPVRHLSGFGQSVLLMPSAPHPELDVGVYRVRVSSFRPNGERGTAVPSVTAVVRLDTADPSVFRTLDVHFHFLNLEDHPCAPLTETGTLVDVSESAGFRGTYTSVLRTILYHAGLAVETTSETILNRPDLDRLDLADVGSLLRLGRHDTGVNVFFVRSLSPAGLQAFAPNPGPAGLGGTPQSGIVIALDTLCYRDWAAVARLTAHEIARYMGLYHTVELATPQHPTWRDPIDDSDLGSAVNLMYFSELAGPDATPSGSELTPGQGDILRRSAVLR